MPWKVTHDLDEDSDGVGLTTCSYFDNETDPEPSFVYSARSDSKNKKDFNGVMENAVKLRRKKLGKITKQNTVVETANAYINDFENKAVTHRGNQ